jgi:quercetin dioxygenase-like cupin family protein
MSSFTKVNVKEVENAAADRGDGFEARMARSRLESQQLGVSYFRYPAGFRSPIAHSHREQEEAYVVVGGAGRAKVDDAIVELGPWDVLRVAPESIRAFEAGPDGLEILAIGGPRPEGGDGVRLDGEFWSD